MPSFGAEGWEPIARAALTCRQRGRDSSLSSRVRVPGTSGPGVMGKASPPCSPSAPPTEIIHLWLAAPPCPVFAMKGLGRVHIWFFFLLPCWLQRRLAALCLASGAALLPACPARGCWVLRGAEPGSPHPRVLGPVAGRSPWSTELLWGRQLERKIRSCFWFEQSHLFGISPNKCLASTFLPPHCLVLLFFF